MAARSWRKPGHRHLDRLRSHQQRDELVDHKAVDAHDRLGAGPQKYMGHQFQHFVGTVAEHQLVAPDLQPLGELAGEIPATAVRVEVHLAQRGGRGGERLGRGAERVFVGGQLVDPGGIEAEFPGHLAIGLPGW